VLVWSRLSGKYARIGCARNSGTERQESVPVDELVPPEQVTRGVEHCYPMAN